MFFFLCYALETGIWYFHLTMWSGTMDLCSLNLYFKLILAFWVVMPKLHWYKMWPFSAFHPFNTWIPMIWFLSVIMIAVLTQTFQQKWLSILLNYFSIQHPYYWSFLYFELVEYLKTSQKCTIKKTRIMASKA